MTTTRTASASALALVAVLGFAAPALAQYAENQDPPEGVEALERDLFTTTDFYLDADLWEDPRYTRCNTPVRLDDMWVDNFVGEWGDCSEGLTLAELQSPYEYQSAEEHYRALMAEAEANGGIDHYSRENPPPDWSGWYNSRTLQPEQWSFGNNVQAGVLMQALTPEYQWRFAQVMYHTAVDNSPQWSSSHCNPEGMVRWFGQAIRDIEFLVTPYQVNMLSGTALDILRQVAIDQEPVTEISQWYGESVGFWHDETLVVWTTNVQGWWMSHALPEFSSSFEMVETFTRDAEGNLHDEVIMYDPEAFLQPMKLDVIYSWLDGMQSNIRFQWKECQTNLWNVGGRLTPVNPGTVIEYRIPDWYSRPWAAVWQENFEEGMQGPPQDTALFGFDGD
ncbi:hypothetical protein [Pseudoroseicyclus sp. CXY001]|uniref:hypothetical protein n=1 Tax=Pseudoroseicyclus sp. CXY001 TaxID=3242492 RepID=UPI00358DC868